jgi:hypothetical protein
MRFCLAALVLVPVALARAGGENAEALARDTLKILKEIKPVLAAIKDVKTAEAARPQLLDLGKQVTALEKRAAALRKDPEQKKRLAELERKVRKDGEPILEDITREVKRIRALVGDHRVLEDVPILKLVDTDNARTERARVDVRTLTLAVQAYFINNGEYPQTLKQLTEKQQDGGQPFLEARTLIDPWGRPYVYEPDTADPLTGRPLIYSQGSRSGDPTGRIRNWPTPPKK